MLGVEITLKRVASLERELPAIAFAAECNLASAAERCDAMLRSEEDENDCDSEGDDSDDGYDSEVPAIGRLSDALQAYYESPTALPLAQEVMISKVKRKQCQHARDVTFGIRRRIVVRMFRLALPGTWRTVEDSRGST